MKEYQISELAETVIRNNITTMAELMKHFDCGQRTIENMLKSNDKRLTDPAVVQKIADSSGLYSDQILEEVKEVA